MVDLPPSPVASPSAVLPSAAVPTGTAPAVVAPPPQPKVWQPVVFPRPTQHLPRRLHAKRIHRLVETFPQGLWDPAFENVLTRIDGRPPYGGNEIQVFTRGVDAFAAMHRGISSAQKEILFESYIFTDDDTGKKMRSALCDAVRRGVKVRLVVDAVGSAKTRNAFWDGMEAQGIEVRQFHPLSPDLFRHPFRDHRKIIVIDRELAFTGGMNIADEYGSSRPREKAKSDEVWRDSHVSVRGPAAWELTVVFAESWRKADGPRFQIDPLDGEPPATASRLQVLDSRPNRGHAESAAAFAAVIAGARRAVWITNAYFAPKRMAIDALGRAAARGVDVRLLLPGKTDVPLVRHAGHGFFGDLLERGVRVFEYQAAMLHAKSLVADGYVSIVGSTNLDFRSFTFNGECNLIVLDEAVGSRLEAAYRDDLASAVEIDLETWRRRGLFHRAADRAARWLAPVL